MDEAILVVDDEKSVRSLLDRILRSKGYANVLLAENAERALELIGKEPVSVVLTDVRMPGMDGIKLLDEIKRIDESIIVIIITAYGSIDQAVECIKRGAADFITKPFSSDIVTLSIDKALADRQLKQEVANLRISVTKRADFMDFVGVSEPMQLVYERIRAVAPTDAPVLITGESGTGKELAAIAVHELSTKREKEMISVSCPNIPPQMLESELFGHVKGAFTDAYKDKEGLFEKADGGTLFLDEIGDITTEVQAKLLRVLQEGEIIPLGSARIKKLDVRLVTSTNKNLSERVAAGGFREDLFYRINVINIHIPPLRERRQDIQRLAHFFLNEYAAKLSKPLKGFTADAVAYLEGRNWEGNVRELKNVVYQGVVFAAGDTVELSDLITGESMSFPVVEGGHDAENASLKELRDKMVKEFEIDYIKRALAKSGGNISKAAREGGMSRQSFQHLMKKYGIKVEE
jgi:DNA-binding NtrC family response regulator